MSKVKISFFHIIRVCWVIISAICFVNGQVHTFPSFAASQYSSQSGTTTDGNVVGGINHGDYLTYANIDFGPSGTTKSIRIRYSKNNNGGRVLFRLGGIGGTIIAVFGPSNTGGWYSYRDVNISIDDDGANINGINDLTFLFKDVDKDFMNLEWVELLDPGTPNIFPQFPATNYYAHSGVTFSNDIAQNIYNDSYLTYSSLNFGPLGTTKSVRVRYSRARNDNSGDKLQLKLGDKAGTLIAEFFPSYTGGWYTFREVNITIDEQANVANIHDLTLLFKSVTTQVIMYVEEIALLNPATPDIFPKFSASDFYAQCCMTFSNGIAQNIYSNFYLTYDQINFGLPGTTKSIRIRYSKGNNGGTSTLHFKKGNTVGTEIATFTPSDTGNWYEYREATIMIDDVAGIHDLTLLFIDTTTNRVMNLDWIELLDSGVPSIFPHIDVIEWYERSSGIVFSNGIGTWIHDHDYLTYNQINFGPSGTTKSIRIRYSKGNNDGGVLKLKLGGIAGTQIAEFSPSDTGSGNTYREATIMIDDVVGIHDLTLYFREGTGTIMNLDWIELLDPGVPSIFPHIDVIEWYERSSGIVFSNGIGTWIHDHDYLTYNQINFGPSGTTKSIRIRYSKGNNKGGVLRLRLGGIGGTQIAEFSPSDTGGWNTYREATIMIDDVVGIHDLTLYFRQGTGTIMYLDWIELLDPGVPSIFPHISAIDWYSQTGTISHEDTGTIRNIHGDDVLIYNNLNFGPSETTTTVRIRYSKASSEGLLRIKLGGIGGTQIASFIPSATGGWHVYQEADIPLTIDVAGINTLALQFKTSTSEIMYLEWIELLGAIPPIPMPRFVPHIPATKYTQKVGTQIFDTVVGSFDSNDYLTYRYLNFGPSGTTTGIYLSYTKGNLGGSIELRLDGPTGTLLAEFTPVNTGSWDTLSVDYVPIGSVSGFQDLCIFGKHGEEIFNLEMIILARENSEPTFSCACNRQLCMNVTS